MHRYIATFSGLSDKATVNVHAHGCSQATRRPGRTAWTLKGTTLKTALKEATEEASESGRKAKVCGCTKKLDLPEQYRTTEAGWR